MMQRVFCLLLLATIACSCSPVSKKKLNKTFRDTEAAYKDHTGFMLYDLDKDKIIYEFNASTYFTPASNIKILTLLTSLKILGDSVPGLRYITRGDSLVFWGTGDPSFLYRNVYPDGRVYSFLRATDKKLFFSSSNFNTSHYGPGWAWDDYSSSYSAERSPFPIYGNLFSVKSNGTRVEIEPPFMMKYLTISGARERTVVSRNLDDNEFVLHPSYQDKSVVDIPFKVDPTLTSHLLADTLNKEVQTISTPLPKNAKLVYSIPSDSLYKVLMQESDNFIAEQLLLLCSGVIGDTLNPETAIAYAKNTFMQNLPDKPIWVDGSGLSRYNLLTPRLIVQLWKEIYSLKPREQLFALLASGGKSGTIRNWYSGDKAFLFGKTGTLRHNHSLSGYLVTRSGKTLVFSFMNSNFTVPVNDIRRNMQTILNSIYENY